MAEPRTAAPRDGRRRDWNAVAAVIAALIGLLALTVSGYTAWLQRQQVRAEVWPYLQRGISPNRRNVTLTNKGVGPASVRRVKVFVDGQPQRSWPEVFDALGLHQLRNTPYSTTRGVVISPGESIQQIRFRDDDSFARFYAEYGRIQVAICYCSALNECWIYDEREGSLEEERRPVEACPAGEADEFIDNQLLEPEALDSMPTGSQEAPG